jgi:uncharacterized repeat protein (TIGR03803 family)
MKKLLVSLALYVSTFMVASFGFQDLLAQADVTLIGLAAKGGAYGAGTIFSVNADGTDFKVLHDFTIADGQQPYGTVVQASDGFLYGTATKGGTYEAGVIFKIKPDGSEFSVLYQFAEEYPYGGLLLGSDGALYGVSESGGYEGLGLVYSIQTDGSNFTVLHSFSWTDEGGLSRGKLVESPDGWLYGTTLFPPTGGEEWGNIFRLRLDGSEFSVLRHSVGIMYGSLLLTSDGALVGMSQINGGMNGTQGTPIIFSTNTDGGDYKLLHELSPPTYGNQLGELIEGPDKKLYGMFFEGGVYGYGSLFEMNPDGTGFTDLFSFNGAPGALPIGSTPVLYENEIFGFTTYGGINDVGVVFKYNLSTTEFTKLADLDEASGKYPVGGSLFVWDKSIKAITALKDFYTVEPNTDTELGILTDGAVIERADVNIGVHTNDSIDFVEFYLDGKRVSNDKNAPFALYAEEHGDYKKGHLKSGSHVLTAIGYSGKRQKEAAKDTLTVHFTVNDISLVSRASIFPNPVKDNFTLEYNGNPNASLSIEIMDQSMMNVKMNARGYTDDEGFLSLSISTANYRKGLYILSVKTNSGDIVRKRFLVE